VGEMISAYVPGRVSLLVPCYNNARFLPDLVQSAFAQTHQDWEMLICNDCSPDNTREIAQDLVMSDPQRFKYFTTPENSGPAVARNICIRNSTGEFMVQMDPDDMLVPDSLEVRVAAIRGDGQESWTCGWLYVVINNTTYAQAMMHMNRGLLHIDKHDPKYRCVSCLPKAGSPSVMGHRNLFVRYGLYDEHPDLYSKTDRELWARWMGFGAMPVHVKSPVTFYRKHPGSIQTNYSKEQIDRANLIRISNLRQRLEDGVDDSNTALWFPDDAEQVKEENTRTRGLVTQIDIIKGVRLDKLLGHIPSHLKGKRKAEARVLLGSRKKQPKLDSTEILEPPSIGRSAPLKVLFPQYETGNKGKLKFFRALALELFKHGIAPTLNRADFDISLAGRREEKKPFIIRLDGLYYTGNYPDREEKNRKIFEHIVPAHGVIFQSKFCELMHKGVAEQMGTDLQLQRKVVEIIYNGAPTRLSKVRKKLIGSPSLLAACRNWLPEKRLKMLLRAFKLLRRRMPKARLYIAGLIPNGMKTAPAVETLGEIKDGKTLLDAMASVDVYAHTVYQDACPNAVVEALSVGTPVVCSQEGGQAELVTHGVNGIVAQCDEGPSYQFVQWREPPADTAKYAAALIEAAQRIPWQVKPTVSDITDSAAQYAAVIKRVYRKYG